MCENTANRGCQRIDRLASSGPLDQLLYVVCGDRANFEHDLGGHLPRS